VANLFIRTYTFVDGTTAYGSQVEAEIGNIVTVLNNLNTAATTWGQVSISHATSVPLIADCASGSQHIADFKNNSVIKASVSSAGAITCVGLAAGSAKITGLAAATTSGDAVRYEQVLTGQIAGTTTNDSASAGNIGQYIESLAGPTNFTTSGHWADLTSISLTAGDWDVTGIFFFNNQGTTTTEIDYGISTTTGDSSTGLTIGSNYQLACLPVGTAVQRTSGTIAAYRISISSTTIMYAKYFATYSGTTPTATCRLSARRVR